MAKKKVEAAAAIRQRVVRTVLMPAGDLKKHPKNFRLHGEDQRRDVMALLDGIGQVAPVIGRDMPDGSVELLDGHLRQELADDRMILVAVTDLNDAEAATVLAMLDYTSGLATIDPAMAADLMRDAKTTPILDDAAWDGFAASLGGPAFAPSLDPASGNNVVTPQDVVTAGEKMKVEFSARTGPQIAEVTCPHCGKSFGVSE